MAFAAFAALPFAIAIAVLRYRLYEIDTIVDRSMVYLPLLGTLAAVFAVGTLVLERVFAGLTEGGPDAALVVSTLVVAALFSPLHKEMNRGSTRGSGGRSGAETVPSGADVRHGVRPTSTGASSSSPAGSWSEILELRTTDPSSVAQVGAPDDDVSAVPLEGPLRGAAPAARSPEAIEGER